jgi:hypothetical protein
MAGTTPAWLRWAALAAAAAVLFVFYFAVLTDLRFMAAPSPPHALMFNSMLEHLLQGRIGVDPEVIGREGFVRNGRTFAYFGPAPVLLRLPMVVFPGLRDVDLTALSCALAATAATLAKFGALLRVARVLGPGRGVALAVGLMAVVLLLGGSQIPYLRPSIYQEPILWAGAQASLFLWLAVAWCLEPERRRGWHLAAMALLAGLCLMTRVSTAIGLHLALGFILLVAGWQALRRDGFGAALGRVLGPGLVLAAFIGVTAWINWVRWGNPLTFQDYRYYVFVAPDHPIMEIIRQHGYFSLGRVPFNLSYYFVPVWMLRGEDGTLIFRATQDRLFFTVEFPPATFLLSDMFLVFLTLLGLWALLRGRVPGDRLSAGLVAAGLAVPGGLMLMAMAATYRYRSEFHPFLEFAALLGLFPLVAGLARGRAGLAAAAVGMAGVSVVSSFAFLLSYKIAQFGDTYFVQRHGWAPVYRTFLYDAYPRLEDLLGPVLGPRIPRGTVYGSD